MSSPRIRHADAKLDILKYRLGLRTTMALFSILSLVIKSKPVNGQCVAKEAIKPKTIVSKPRKK
jgi:hypothetical protein